jgi:hypothetical protein
MWDNYLRMIKNGEALLKEASLMLDQARAMAATLCNSRKSGIFAS